MNNSQRIIKGKKCIIFMRTSKGDGRDQKSLPQAEACRKVAWKLFGVSDVDLQGSRAR